MGTNRASLFKVTGISFVIIMDLEFEMSQVCLTLHFASNYEFWQSSLSMQCFYMFRRALTIHIVSCAAFYGVYYKKWIVILLNFTNLAFSMTRMTRKFDPCGILNTKHFSSKYLLLRTFWHLRT